MAFENSISVSKNLGIIGLYVTVRTLVRPVTLIPTMTVYLIFTQFTCLLYNFNTSDLLLHSEKDAFQDVPHG